MRVFLSYSAADRKLAERLREELRQGGLDVWFDAEMPQDTEWSSRIEKAIRSADDIVILVGSRSSADPIQKFTWRTALEAVWEDSHKRLIPVLLRDAPLPPFVYGDSAGDETRVVRLVDTRDLRGAAQAIRLALTGASAAPLKAVEGRYRSVPRGSGPTKSRSADPDPPVVYKSGYSAGSSSVDVGTKSGYAADLEAERTGRLREIEDFAERLKG